MTQDERWEIRYKEVKGFIEENHRNPSKHDMLNWVKQQRKLMKNLHNSRSNLAK